MLIKLYMYYCVKFLYAKYNKILFDKFVLYIYEYNKILFDEFVMYI